MEMVINENDIFAKKSTDKLDYCNNSFISAMSGGKQPNYFSNQTKYLHIGRIAIYKIYCMLLYTLSVRITLGTKINYTLQNWLISQNVGVLD